VISVVIFVSLSMLKLFAFTQTALSFRSNNTRWRVLVFCTACCLSGWGNATRADDFLDPEKAFVLTATMSAPDRVALKFKIAKDYYMYRERFSIELSELVPAPLVSISLGQAVFPVGKIKHDANFNKDMELYFDQVVIQLPLVFSNETPNAAGDNKLPALALKIVGQGCALAGLCYPPMDFVVKLTPSSDGAGYVVASHASAGAFDRLAKADWGDLLFSGDDLSLADLLSSSGLLEIVLLFFVLGVLLALTPCVLPMVPILSAILVGQQLTTRRRGLVLACAYVGGMSVVYTLLGVAAGLSGAGLAAWLQTPWALTFFALLLAVLALAMFDVFQFQMPVHIQTKLTEKQAGLNSGRVVAAAVMGALSALVVGPCVAAPLAGALLYISQTGDVLLGGLALFAMAWGMGVPLLLMGASAGKLMPRTGAWMEGVKQFFGILLLATAWWLVNPLLPSWLHILGWAGLALFAAVLLRTFDALPQSAHGKHLSKVVRKTLGLLLTLIAILWVVGVASGGRSLLTPLAHLARNADTLNEVPAQVLTAKQQLLNPKALNLANAPNASSALNTLTGPKQAEPGMTSQSGPLSFERVQSVKALDAILAQTDRPVMLDFYADWCVSCKEMEAFTFVDRRVSQRLTQMLLLQADVTANNADDRELLKRFRLFGPPGIMFFSKEGKLLKDLRVVGFQDAGRFAATLERVLKQE
jgi:thiol:disulfide interchange protein DsbD